MYLDKKELLNIINAFTNIKSYDEIVSKKNIFNSIQETLDLYNQLITFFDIDEDSNGSTNSIISCLIDKICATKQDLSKIRFESVELKRQIRYLDNIKFSHEKISTETMCENCNVEMTYNKKHFMCPICKTIKFNNVDDYNIDTTNKETTNKNSNIVKHLHKNISYIYGLVKPASLPEPVIKIICANIKKAIPDIKSRVHYTEPVYKLMDKMQPIKYGNKLYNPKVYRTNANYFIINTYDLKIPRLNEADEQSFIEIFLNITSKYQDLYNASYIINYQHLAHRILYMRFLDKPGVSELLRFIYIQKKSSFDKKDKKLLNVNNHINCFPEFLFTPHDIYTNMVYYPNSN